MVVTNTLICVFVDFLKYCSEERTTEIHRWAFVRHARCSHDLFSSSWMFYTKGVKGIDISLVTCSFNYFIFKLLSKLRWDVLKETSEIIKFDVFAHYSAILVNDHSVSFKSFVLHKKSTHLVSPTQHSGGVLGLCSVLAFAVVVCAKYGHHDKRWSKTTATFPERQFDCGNQLLIKEKVWSFALHNRQ
jgi:hypothetical protein